MGSIPTAFPLASSLPKGETGTVSTEEGSLQGVKVLKAKPASYFAWRGNGGRVLLKVSKRK